MTNKTKYFHRDFRNATEWKEVPLDKDHWWFVQVDATIHTAFSRYGLHEPSAVYVDDYETFSNIYIVRNNLKNPMEVTDWLFKFSSLKNELNLAAEANSDEYLTYKFIIL